MPKRYNCNFCGEELGEIACGGKYPGSFCSPVCANESDTMYELKKRTKVPREFNEPEHYHQHDMDTITFLQKGFPPHVCMGFLLGNVVKYAQRAEYKNGLEDFEKMVDYAKRALEWYKKNPSK